MLKLRSVALLVLFAVTANYSYQDSRERYAAYKEYAACHTHCRETRGGKVCRAKCPQYP